MSDELKPIELELMSLFDRDISAERREILIEKLQDHPEMLERYSAYLHLQDIELTADDIPPKYVRDKVLKAAYRRNRTLRWRERLSHFVRALSSPAVAGPAVLCLAVLVGYELMDSTTNNSSSTDLKSVSSALKDTTSLNKQSASEKVQIGSKTPKMALGEPRDDVDADSKAAIDRMNLESSPVKVTKKSSASNSIAGNLAVNSQKKSKVRGGTARAKQKLAQTKKDSQKTRLEKVKSTLSRAKTGRSDPRTRKTFEFAKVGEPKPRAAKESLSADKPSSSRTSVDLKRSPKYEIAAMKAPEDSASPKMRSMGELTKPSSIGTRDDEKAQNRGSVSMRRSPDIVARKSRSKRRAKLIDSDADSYEVNTQASETGHPPPAQMMAAENEDTNIKSETQGSSSGLIANSAEKKSFESFVRSLNRSESLDGIPSPLLLEMTEVALKLGEYSKAQLWLRNVIGRQDELQERANLLLKKLRARHNP